MSFRPGKAEETEGNGQTSDLSAEASADVILALPAPESNGGESTSAAPADVILALHAPESNGEMGEARTDTKLQTRLNPETLQRKLLTLYRDAKSLVEEQGVHVLYLALGFLEWYEAPTSEIARIAPLILLPVELVRDNVRSAFKLVIREEDLSANASRAPQWHSHLTITAI